ncbi:protein-L-isoaspartate O-methyltransferase family protein [Natrialbaceae archaeon A-chndr2]
MDAAVLREDMIDGLVHESKAVLEDEALTVAMGAVPRHEFVPEGTAYADRDHEHLGTRVLAPSTVARLLEALSASPGHSTLIVGAGVGYTAAVLAELVGESNVHAVDIARPIVYEARTMLERAGYGGVLVDCRDGAAGLSTYAPFDRILLEAATVSPPRALLEQLRDDGVLVFPRITASGKQRLEAHTRAGTLESFGAVSFEPLLVDGEQAGTLERNRTAREDGEYAARRAQSRTGWERDWIEWDGVSSR